MAEQLRSFQQAPDLNPTENLDEARYRETYGESGRVTRGRYVRATLRSRKVWFIFVGLSNLLNLVLIIVTLVQPTPIFGKTVLFSMRSIEEASLLRRSWSGASLLSEELPHSASLDYEKQNTECLHGLSSTCQGPPWIEREPLLAIRARDRTTRYITTYTTVTGTRIVKPSSASHSKPTKTSSPNKPSQPAEAGFQALYIGPMGVCLDEKNSFQICSGASLTPTFTSTYKESSLSTDVIRLLPTGTSGATVVLFLALLAYAAAVLAFALSYKSAINARTPDGHRAYTKPRYVSLLAVATVANTVGVILLVTCLLIFGKVFRQALEGIPKLPYELFPKGGGATGPIIVTSVTGALSTLVCIYILVGDLRLIVTENALGRRQKIEELKKAQKRSRNDSFRTRRQEGIPTSLQPGGIIPDKGETPRSEDQTPPTKSNARKRSRTMSFIRNLARTPKAKASRFLDVAAAAEVPPDPVTSVEQSRTAPPTSLRSPDHSPGFPSTGLEADDGFASVARMQDEINVTGRYADLDAEVVRAPLPPRFKSFIS